MAGAWALRPAVRPAKAKSVIQIWMWGGPCHIDTFDPKPDCRLRFLRRAATSPLPRTSTACMIGELLPLLAKQADKYSLIRSMTHGS